MSLPGFQDLPRQDAPARAGLSRIAGSIAIASGLAEAGRAIDLAGIDRAAALLCAQVLDLPPADGAAIRPALVALEANMASLFGTIQARRTRPHPPGKRPPHAPPTQ